MGRESVVPACGEDASLVGAPDFGGVGFCEISLSSRNFRGGRLREGLRSGWDNEHRSKSKNMSMPWCRVLSHQCSLRGADHGRKMELQEASFFMVLRTMRRSLNG